jgi:GNAT superfamily N-acetyltransferase
MQKNTLQNCNTGKLTRWVGSLNWLKQNKFMVPRKLHPLTDLKKLRQHFREDISGDDRRLRFGIALPDHSIEEYINKSIIGLGFKNQWFIVEDFGKIVGTCHANIYEGGKTAELGITVSQAYRNRGLGSQLFERGTTWSRSRGASDMYMYCLAENRAIQKIARNHNMIVHSEDYNEKTALAKLDKNVLTSYVEDRILEQIALYDMALNKYLSFFNYKIIDNKS